MRRLLRLTLRILLVLLGVVLLAAGGAWLAARDTRGAAPSGNRLARVVASPQWRGDRFGNPWPRRDAPPGRMLRRWVAGGSPHATPDAAIPTERRTRGDYDVAPASGLRVTWLGHSTLLLEIDGQRVLIDPVWGKRASPFSFLGPKRFYAPPLPLSELPDVDVVVISHDHYDHLDLPTVRALAARDVRWVVPLGVGAHLEAWGVPASRISEHDWWEATTVGGLTITATPARHFSGRWIDDANRTLWTGWTFAGPAHRVYYSGDTALFEEMIDIGTRLGPFDLTLIETGAYDAMWPDVHLGPEQAVRAHRLVRGEVLLPVHWGLFDLALHGWTEPIERVLAAADLEDVRVVMPMPGGRVEPASAESPTRWWPDVPWVPASKNAVYSTGTEALRARTAPGRDDATSPRPASSGAVPPPR